MKWWRKWSEKSKISRPFFIWHVCLVSPFTWLIISVFLYKAHRINYFHSLLLHGSKRSAFTRRGVWNNNEKNNNNNDSIRNKFSKAKITTNKQTSHSWTKSLMQPTFRRYVCLKPLWKNDKLLIRFLLSHINLVFSSFSRLDMNFL